VAQLAQTYYPDLNVIEKNLWELKLPPFTISCDGPTLIQAAFPHQSTKVLWLPHGNSDKGFNGPFFENLGEAAFVYGQKMVDFMHAKKTHIQTFRIGNFRHHYYLKHQEFYQKKIALPQHKNTLFYAPTWDDLEGNNSFWKAFPTLCDQLPNNIHLLVKLHPNTLRKFEIEIDLLKFSYAKNNRVTFLPEIPPIYPILNQVDGYIGDMSSIGYDFLQFDKPLYFLNANPKLPLHKCGAHLNLNALKLPREDPFSSVRKKTSSYTFDATPNWDHLKEQIDAFCSL